MSSNLAPQISAKRRITALIVSNKTQHLCFNPLVTIDHCDTIKALVQKAMNLYVKQASADSTKPAIISLHTKNAGQLATIADEDDLIGDVIGQEAQITILVQDAMDLITFDNGRPLLQLATPVPSKSPSLELNSHQYGNIKRLPKHLKDKKSSKKIGTSQKAMAKTNSMRGPQKTGALALVENPVPSAQSSKSATRKRNKRLRLKENQQAIEHLKANKLTSNPTIKSKESSFSINQPEKVSQQPPPVLSPCVDKDSSQISKLPTEFTEQEEEKDSPVSKCKKNSQRQTLKRSRSRSPIFSTPSKRKRVLASIGPSPTFPVQLLPSNKNRCDSPELQYNVCDEQPLQESTTMATDNISSQDALNAIHSRSQQNDENGSLVMEIPRPEAERPPELNVLTQTEDCLDPLTAENAVPLTEKNLQFVVSQHESPPAQRYSSVKSSSVCSADFNQASLVVPSRSPPADRTDSLGSAGYDLQEDYTAASRVLANDRVPERWDAEAQALHASEGASLKSSSTSDLDTDMENLADFISVSSASSDADEIVDMNRDIVQTLDTKPEEELDTNSMNSASSSSQSDSDDNSVTKLSDQHADIVAGLEENRTPGFSEINATEDMIDNESIVVTENEHSSTSGNPTSPYIPFATRPLLRSHNYKSLSFLHEQLQRNKDELSQIAKPVGMSNVLKADDEPEDGEGSSSDGDTSDSSAKSQASDLDLPPEKRAKFVKKQKRLKRQSAGARALLAL